MTSVQVKIGAFVKVSVQPYAEWGVGKFLGAAAGRGRVQYFNAPGAETAEVIECLLAQVKPAKLPMQTRVYRRYAASRWQVGRVLEDHGKTLFVQFPNGESASVEAGDLQVRWNRPLQDPLPLLISEATESPFLSDARSSFTQQVALQYTAASGITAMLSSSIELVDYQFEVVRRVLTDPVQRYLLADEVGLGKTIEAAVVVRQYFLDDPDTARAVIVAPAALVPQWRDELSGKFCLSSALDDFLHVVCNDDLEALEELLPHAGMLVVDEAHYLSRSVVDEKINELYRLLQEHSRRIPRLLLLSATPVLSDPEGFLRVLHLLDPVAFPLDDLDGLRRRIATRQIIAEVVAALVPENLWVLSGELDRLQEAYADDVVLMDKIARLRAVMDTFPEEHDEGYLAALADLKMHLIESYRLHRRLLRNRREACQWATPRRAGLKRVSFQGEATARWKLRIDELRVCLNGLEVLPDSLRPAMFEAAVNTRAAVSIRTVLEQHDVRDDVALDIASAVDTSAARMREGHERFDALARIVEQTLGTPDTQVVVFCSESSDADRATERLRRSLGTQVTRHEVREDLDDDDTPLPWQRFLSAPAQVRVLVCDARAEEGVNLHGGKKVAVHFDTPTSPNRCEQRLGRLDRFGTGDPIVSFALQDDVNPDEAAWIDTLDTGWKVFDRSVASLQYLMESAFQHLSAAWMLEGTDAIREHQAWLAGPEGRLQREVRQINQQDALDALSEQESDAFDLLSERDQEWRAWRTAFTGFAIEALKFQARREAPKPSSDDADTSFRLGYLIRDDGPITLIPLGGYLKTFLQSIDADAPNSTLRSPLTHQYVFRRQNALTRTARAQRTRVLRVGDPLVTALEQFCAQDDRGRAFAMWRVDREYEADDPSGADLYFRFDFVIRPTAIDAVLRAEKPEMRNILERALVRKTRAFFPPLFVSVWVDGAGMLVPEPGERLTAHYHDRWQGHRRDYNLNPRRWREIRASVQSTWMRDWPELCRAARKQAEAVALASEACQQQIRRALAALEGEHRLRHSQAESRLARLGGAQRHQALDELAADEALYAVIRDTLIDPVLDLDVAGAVFLASDHPFEQ